MQAMCPEEKDEGLSRIEQPSWSIPKLAQRTHRTLYPARVADHLYITQISIQNLGGPKQKFTRDIGVNMIDLVAPPSNHYINKSNNRLIITALIFGRTMSIISKDSNVRTLRFLVN